MPRAGPRRCAFPAPRWIDMTPVVDVHTHMLNGEWLALLEKHGRPRYTLATVPGGLRAIHLDGAPFMTPVPEMFDWDLRVKNMDKTGIDVSVVSLTCPNCYWGGEAVSLKAARTMNDEMARARKSFPDRIQWFCSLPWQYPKAAVKELGGGERGGRPRQGGGRGGCWCSQPERGAPSPPRASRPSGGRSTSGACR